MPTCFNISKISVVDWHNFDADWGSDPNPTFHFDAKPDRILLQAQVLHMLQCQKYPKFQYF
jgi:hypothetical protein